MAPSAIFTAAQVAEHATDKDCWVIIHDKGETLD